MRSALDHSRPSRKFLRERRAVRRQHRLGMELHADDRQLAVAHRHHLAVVRVRGRLELVGQARRRERVVAARVERLRQPGEEAACRRAARGSPCRAAARARSRPRRRTPRRSPGARGRRRASGSSARAADDLDRDACVGGPAGTGETTRCDGASCSASSALISSLRSTRHVDAELRRRGARGCT